MTNPMYQPLLIRWRSAGTCSRKLDTRFAAEKKLIEAEKRNADARIYQSNWREQEKLTAAVAQLQNDKTLILGELERTRLQLAEVTTQMMQQDNNFAVRKGEVRIKQCFANPLTILNCYYQQVPSYY